MNRPVSSIGVRSDWEQQASSLPSGAITAMEGESIRARSNEVLARQRRVLVCQRRVSRLIASSTSATVYLYTESSSHIPCLSKVYQ